MLDNLTPVDRYATICEQIKELEAQKAVLRAELIALAGDVAPKAPKIIPGDLADLTVSAVEVKPFDADIAKSFLNAEQLAACFTRTRTDIRLTPKPKTAKEG